MSIAPGEEIIVPMYCEYKLTKNSNSTIKKTISFDIRTSLYHDPINYTFTVSAKNTTTVQDKVVIANRRKFSSPLSSLGNLFKKPVNYFTTIK